MYKCSKNPEITEDLLDEFSSYLFIPKDERHTYKPSKYGFRVEMESCLREHIRDCLDCEREINSIIVELEAIVRVVSGTGFNGVIKQARRELEINKAGD